VPGGNGWIYEAHEGENDMDYIEGSGRRSD